MAILVFLILSAPVTTPGLLDGRDSPAVLLLLAAVAVVAVP